VWLNTAALTVSGITKDTEDPAGGRIVRDGSGAPTGVLIDEAMSLVQTPEDAPDDRRLWTAQAFELMAKAGLTGAHAMGLSDESLAVYTALAESGEMPVRIWAYVEPESQAAERLMATGPWTVGHLEVVGVKAFADGALGSRGAWLTDAYADEPGHFGMPIHAPADIQQWATALHATGASMAVHSIGDRAVHHTVQSFVAAHAAHPESQATLRVEHAQLLRPEDRLLMVEHGLIASMQPTHATSDMPWAIDRVGPERLQWAYTWRTVLDAGIPLAFGSDFPVESHRPALGLWSATHRTDLTGQPEGGWTPSERVSEDEAITAFTRGSAVAVGNDTLGFVRAGAPADLTLWSPASDVPWTPVGTVVDGQVVFVATIGAGSE
jgi:predicted amidohydrolase YtcJ